MNNNSNPLAGPVTALVEFEIRSDTTTMEQWLDVWGTRGLAALAEEPETTAYEAAQCEADEQRVVVYERYAQGQSSIDQHRRHPAHAQLQETMGERNMTKRRVMTSLFADIDDYGWWSRPERVDVLRIRGVRLTVIITRFPDDATKSRYIKLTGDHAKYCWDNEPDTLIYAGGLALQDADRGPIRQGDLLFVAAFADDAAAIKHRDDPVHVALQPKLAELQRERVLLQTYRTSGNGYLWAGETRRPATK